MGATWTPERTEKLRCMVDGGLSASQIAAALGGITRNSVIGRMRRTGLESHNAPNGKGTTREYKPRRTRIASAHTGGTTQRMNNRANGSNAPVEPIPINIGLAEFNAAIAQDQIKTLVELGNCDCRWPLNDRSPYLFCGAPEAAMDERKPYCGFHSRLAERS